jgi:hypothetical protein
MWAIYTTSRHTQACKKAIFDRFCWVARGHFVWMGKLKTKTIDLIQAFWMYCSVLYDRSGTSGTRNTKRWALNTKWLRENKQTLPGRVTLLLTLITVLQEPHWSRLFGILQARASLPHSSATALYPRKDNGGDAKLEQFVRSRKASSCRTILCVLHLASSAGSWW